MANESTGPFGGSVVPCNSLRPPPLPLPLQGPTTLEAYRRLNNKLTRVRTYTYLNCAPPLASAPSSLFLLSFFCLSPQQIIVNGVYAATRRIAPEVSSATCATVVLAAVPPVTAASSASVDDQTPTITPCAFMPNNNHPDAEWGGMLSELIEQETEQSAARRSAAAAEEATETTEDEDGHNGDHSSTGGAAHLFRGRPVESIEFHVWWCILLLLLLLLRAGGHGCPSWRFYRRPSFLPRCGPRLRSGSQQDRAKLERMNNMSIRLCVLAFFGQSRKRVVRTPQRSRWDVVAVCALLTFVLNIGPAHAALDFDVCTRVTQEKRCILACTWDGSKCVGNDKCALAGVLGKEACTAAGTMLGLGCTWDGNRDGNKCATTYCSADSSISSSSSDWYRCGSNCDGVSVGVPSSSLPDCCNGNNCCVITKKFPCVAALTDATFKEATWGMCLPCYASTHH